MPGNLSLGRVICFSVEIGKDDNREITPEQDKGMGSSVGKNGRSNLLNPIRQMEMKTRQRALTCPAIAIGKLSHSLYQYPIHFGVKSSNSRDSSNRNNNISKPSYSLVLFVNPNLFTKTYRTIYISSCALFLGRIW